MIVAGKRSVEGTINQRWEGRMRGLAGGIVATLGVAVVMTACEAGSGGGGGGGTSMANRPECPITSDTIVVDSLSNPAAHIVVQTVPVAGGITHVPEFHDCQRFIVRGTNDSIVYDSLYGIFASFQLDRLGDTLGGEPPRAGKAEGQPADSVTSLVAGPIPRDSLAGVVGRSAPSGNRSRAVSFVEIYSWGGNYDPLGIHRGFNCLYLYKEGHDWRAFMAAVTDGDVCLTPLHLVPAAKIRFLKPLQVTPRSPPMVSGVQLKAGDIPPVARWDWDLRHRKQIIGVRCGSQWCLVGQDLNPQFAPTPTIPDFAAVAGLTATPAEVRRVAGMRGWFDFQQLATMVPAGKPVPSNVNGWIVPNPVLHRIDNIVLFEKQWVHAATVYVSAPYSNGLASFSPGANRIWVCRQRPGETNCGVVPTLAPKGGCPNPDVWWARVDPAGTIRRICRRGHDAPPPPPGTPRVPGTSRWRWMATDETTWKRCMEGCCEIQ